MTDAMAHTPHVLVHKEGEEGVFTIDRLTGRITTPIDERPEWCDGLATALIQERLKFYKDRLGDGTQFAAIEAATAIEYSDLGWIGVDAEGDEVEIEADPATRTEMLAAALGMDEEGELTDRSRVLAETEADTQNTSMTAEELKALEEARDVGVGGALAAEAAKKAANSQE